MSGWLLYKLLELLFLKLDPPLGESLSEEIEAGVRFLIRFLAMSDEPFSSVSFTDSSRTSTIWSGLGFLLKLMRFVCCWLSSSSSLKISVTNESTVSFLLILSFKVSFYLSLARASLILESKLLPNLKVLDLRALSLSTFGGSFADGFTVPW